MSILGEGLSARSLLLLFTFSSMFGDVCPSGQYFYYSNAWCKIPPRHGNDPEYINEYHFNGKLLIRYNSTEEKYSGFNPIAIAHLPGWNNPYDIQIRNAEKQLLCINFVAKFWDMTKGAIVEPKVRLRSVKPMSSRHTAMLVCSAYNFYPKQIKVTWRKDGQDVTSDVISTEEMSNLDWTYQIHTYLEYTPKVGERITCMVEHASLFSPMLYDWDPLPESERNKVAVGASGLLLGMACVAAGLIKYRRKSIAGRVLVPTS